MFRYGLNRFSEGLDFTSIDENQPDDLMQTIRDDLRYLGIESNLKVITDNDISLSFRFGAEGPLFTKEIERCYVRIEVSRREFVLLATDPFFMNSQYPDILPFSVSTMNIQEIMAEKVRAIMTRDKARDVYDLWYLMTDKGEEGAGSFWKEDMITMINRKLEYYGLMFDPKQFVERIHEKEDLWKAELTPIIFGTLPDYETVHHELLQFLNIDLS